MMNKNIFLLTFMFLSSTQSFFGAVSLLQQFQEVGYAEFCDEYHGSKDFDALYASFDTFIEFLQTNPVWEKKLYNAKERFIRCKDRNYYATDFFGLYDESDTVGRYQISFYYSIHFHEFICLHYPEIKKIPELINFFQNCSQIQKPYHDIFYQAAQQLGFPQIFNSDYGKPPILFKVVKYLACYQAIMPHYDGTAFSLFLDSTDYQSLLLAAYKSVLHADDFYVPLRNFSRQEYRNSILLIPGALLTEFSIYPTPHIVVHSGTTRYATIAFAMRPNYVMSKHELATLPVLKY